MSIPGALRTLVTVLNLNRATIQAMGLDAELDLPIAGVSATSPAAELARVQREVRALFDDMTSARDLVAASALDLVAASARDLVVAVARDLVARRSPAPAFTRGLATQLNHFRADVDTLAADLARIGAHVPAYDLTDATARAEAIGRAITRAEAQARTAAHLRQFGDRRVVPSAAGLLAAAARLLPAADRERYAAEYESELWELAQAGDGRIRQLRYALRQLRRAPVMGFARGSPRRRSAAP